MLADYFNHSDSQTKLGFFYFNEILVKKDINKAIEYFKMAARNSNPKSLFCLSGIFRYGLPEFEIESNLSEANRYLQLAAEHGYKPAVEYLDKSREFSNVSKDDAITITVLGDNNVGKTSFINFILNKNNDSLLFPITSNIRDYYSPVILNKYKKIHMY